jgi:hypothetical protein
MIAAARRTTPSGSILQSGLHIRSSRNRSFQASLRSSHAPGSITSSFGVTSAPRFTPGVALGASARSYGEKGERVSDMDDIGMESTIGERIKRLRTSVLMTQDDLAAAAGCLPS